MLSVTYKPFMLSVTVLNVVMLSVIVHFTLLFIVCLSQVYLETLGFLSDTYFHCLTKAPIKKTLPRDLELSILVLAIPNEKMKTKINIDDGFFIINHIWAQ